MKITKQDILDEILKEYDDDTDEEEVIHLLLQKKISDNVHKRVKNKYTIGQKAADSIAKFAGSWTFIIIFCLCLILWMIINVVFLLNKGFDPYPFILLNLVLSCVAAIQAPLIMMSQNRQESIDRERAENDYKVNLKTEYIIYDLHQKIDVILDNQGMIKQELNKKK